METNKETSKEKKKHVYKFNWIDPKHNKYSRNTASGVTVRKQQKG